jgi:hypothetical protein
MNPAHAWALKGAALPYLKWMAGRRLMRVASPHLPQMPKALREHAEYACDRLPRMALEISNTMFRFQLKLADRQCRMAELSQRCQDLITILTTSMYGARQTEAIVQDAADIMCQKLRQKLLGRRPSNQYFRQVTALGEEIANGQFNSIAGIEADEILMPYEQ